MHNLGLRETRRQDVPQGKFTLIFLATEHDFEQAQQHHCSKIKLTYNWDSDEQYQTGRSWGHLAFRVTDIYATCQRLQDNGVKIMRPLRDGKMAFIKSPDGVSIELIQDGDALPAQEP